MLERSNEIRANAVDFKQNLFNGFINTKDAFINPLVTGYAFIVWTKVPKWVTDKYADFQIMTEKNLKSFTGNDDIEIQAIELQNGFTSTNSQYAGGVSRNTGFSMSHIELTGSPIKSAYDFWVSGIRDPYTGLANYPQLGYEYAAKNHTGELLYIVTTPAGPYGSSNKKEIEFAAYYTNVMPTKISLGHLNFTAGSQESPTIEMPFFADRWIGPQIETFAASVIDAIAGRHDFKNAYAPFDKLEASVK